ncbi:MAG: PTS sugar transporter subunit IIB [Erysipelotrichaceae bacterium]|jgi:PTS system mannose-specific IIB component|nr:PTS sugar transporter subunit IIB [Erysipelotrichaceae bacterium]
MIKHLRIDNRLIHGQVAVTWMNSIGADKIIVCNDKVAADPIQKMALPMAARGNTVYVFSVAETIKYAQDHPDETMFVICKFPSDALQVLESGVEVKEVNVGNAAPIQGTNYKMVTKSIAVTEDDAKCYRKIAEMRGGVLTSRLTTMNETENFLDLLSKNGL